MPTRDFQDPVVLEFPRETGAVPSQSRRKETAPDLRTEKKVEFWRVEHLAAVVVTPEMEVVLAVAAEASRTFKFPEYL